MSIEDLEQKSEWSDAITLSGAYLDAHNKLTRQGIGTPVPTYLFDWLPHLKPSGAMVYIAARQLCFENSKQDWFTRNQDTLARNAGLSRNGCKNALARPSTALLIRKQHRYLYDPRLGKRVNDTNRYTVLLDLPLAPRDRRGLNSLLRQAQNQRGSPGVITEVKRLLTLSPAVLTDILSQAAVIQANEPDALVVDTVTSLTIARLGRDLSTAEADLCSQLHTAITQPNQTVWCSWNLRRRWFPLLEPTEAMLILYLKSRCYWNPTTNELRDTCTTSWAELTKVIGCHRRTLPRLWKRVQADPQSPLRHWLDLVDTRGQRRSLQLTFRHLGLVREPLPPSIQSEYQRLLNQSASAPAGDTQQPCLFDLSDHPNDPVSDRLPGRSGLPGSTCLTEGLPEPRSTLETPGCVTDEKGTFVALGEAEKPTETPGYSTFVALGEADMVLLWPAIGTFVAGGVITSITLEGGKEIYFLLCWLISAFAKSAAS